MDKETFSSMAYYAMKRIQLQIDRNVKAAKREIASHDISYAVEHGFSNKYITNSIKRRSSYLIPSYAVRITVRDRVHFYALVDWFNQNVGKGTQFWSVKGKILKYVDPSKPNYDPPVTRRFLIYVSGINYTPMFSL